MKIIMIAILLLFINLSVCPQDFRRGGQDPQKRVNQLEKVKLMEVLELDDQTAVKFFNMKDQHQNKMRDLREKSEDILNRIQETLSSGDSKKESSLNRLLEEYKANEAELSGLRKDFLSDAQNILTTEKYGRYLVFERNFREEMRKIIMKDRMKRRMMPE